MDDQMISFFENDLEVCVEELLSQYDSTDCLKKWGRALTQKQLAYVLEKLEHSNTLLPKEQTKAFENNLNLFKEEYLVSQFSLFKSPNLIRTVFNGTFGDNPPLTTTDKFVQLLALYRLKKELLLRVYSFQKIQRRGGIVYNIVCENPNSIGSFEAFATRQNITNLAKTCYYSAMQRPLFC